MVIQGIRHRREHENIVPGTAPQLILPGTTVQHIIPAVAHQDVVCIIADNHIISAPAEGIFNHHTVCD